MRNPTQQEIDDFINYRANHVALVQKLGNLLFKMDFSDHDNDKINAIGKKLELFALRQASKHGKLKLSAKDKEILRKVSANHALHSKHHGEYWDININIRNFDENDNNIINCKRMPNRYLKEMICDWASCSIYNNEPIFQWYNKTCTGDNPRFLFTDRQKKVIIDGLNKIEKAIKKEHLSYPGITYNSKQVEPLKESTISENIFYHGSQNPNISEFNLTKGRFGLGVYFFPDKDRAEAWSNNGYVYKVKIACNHPLMYHQESDCFASLGIPFDGDTETLNFLKSKGYDCIKVSYYDEFVEMVVLNPSDIEIIDMYKVNDNLSEKIIKKGNKWQVTDHTGTKNLGTYNTKSDAEKRLKQVEYFKNMKETNTNKFLQRYILMKESRTAMEFNFKTDYDSNVFRKEMPFIWTYVDCSKPKRLTIYWDSNNDYIDFMNQLPSKTKKLIVNKELLREEVCSSSFSGFAPDNPISIITNPIENDKIKEC